MGDEIVLNIKPMSVNGAWQGRRFKTPAYKTYESQILLMLPKITIPEGDLKLSIEFGFSNKNSDCSNPIKLIEDILQKKYEFNDSRVYEISARKVIVKKGEEYIKFSIVKNGKDINASSVKC